MKKIFVFLFLISMVSANSQEPTSFKSKEGDNALLFSLDGLYQLGPDNFSGGLGYEIYFSNNAAFRFAIGMSYEEEFLGKPENLDIDYEKTAFGLTLKPGIKLNFSANRTVVAYYGAELLFSYSNELEAGVDFQDYEASTDIFTVGAGAFLGAEWFAFQNISLSAEYCLSFTKEFGSSTTTASGQSQTDDLPDKTKFELGINSFNFILSFYFN